MRHLIAENHHIAFLNFVQGVEPPSLLHREKADSVVLRFDPVELAARARELADRMHVVAGEDGSNGAYVRRFFTDVEVILVSKMVLAGGVHAPLNRRGAAREHHDDVFAIFRKVAPVARAEALAQPDQQQQGPDTPGDAEHGEERT